MKDFTVKFHLADSEYMTALRLVCGAVCSAHGLDLDELEDFKVCVTESAIILKNCGFESVTATFTARAARPKKGRTSCPLRSFPRSLRSAIL